MATQEDVENALVGLCAGALFSSPYTPGSPAASLAGLTLKLYRGWPDSANIDADAAQSLLATPVLIGHVCIFAVPNAVRDVTRVELGWHVAVRGAPTLTAELTGNTTIAFGGAGGVGQVVQVTVGSRAAQQSVAYRLVSTDTPSTVAPALVGLLSGLRPAVTASATGAALSITSAQPGTVAIAADGVAVMETQRQEQLFKISIYCPTPPTRGAVSDAISHALAAVGLGSDGTGLIGRFLAADGLSWCKISFVSDLTNDRTSKAYLWLKQFSYCVEYPTLLAAAQPAMLAGAAELRGNGYPVPSRLGVALPAPTLGAIRWDAWYDPTWAVTQAVEADLSPGQFNYRLPFFAAVTDGVASLPAASQANMDAEIAAAATAKLDYWAFLGWPPGSSGGIALALYLSSTHRGSVNFCMIEQFVNIYAGGYTAELAATLALVTQAGYQSVLGGRPLMYFLACDEPTLASTFGSRAGLAAVMAYVRGQIQAATGQNPYFVVMDPAPARAAGLVAWGFDAAGAYSVPGTIVAETAYAGLVASTQAWWQAAALWGVEVVPPVMCGWNTLPRIVTPNALFGSEAFGLPGAYYDDATGAELAAHADAALAWLVRNRAAAPAQTTLAYAWNEFDEGGWLCPTWLSGHPAGDASRVTALGAR